MLGTRELSVDVFQQKEYNSAAEVQGVIRLQENASPSNFNPRKPSRRSRRSPEKTKAKLFSCHLGSPGPPPQSPRLPSIALKRSIQRSDSPLSRSSVELGYPSAQLLTTKASNDSDSRRRLRPLASTTTYVCLETVERGRNVARQQAHSERCGSSPRRSPRGSPRRSPGDRQTGYVHEAFHRAPRQLSLRGNFQPRISKDQVTFYAKQLGMQSSPSFVMDNRYAVVGESRSVHIGCRRTLSFSVDENSALTSSPR